MSKETTEATYIELNDELYKKIEKIYINNDANGELIFKFLSALRSSNENLFNEFMKELYSLDKDIDRRNSSMQKITINRVLIKYLMVISIHAGLDVNAALVNCVNSLEDDVWLNGVLTTVVPVLLNNLDFNKEK